MHDLHRAVGAVLRSIEYPNIEVLLDSACGGQGKQLRLYGGEMAEGDSFLASVDGALILNSKIRVVIVIDLSDVRPLYLCGKVFATALSSYHSREFRIPLADRMMFIQVIQHPDLQSRIFSEAAGRRKSKRTYKLPQYVHLEREINALTRHEKSNTALCLPLRLL